MLIQSWSAQLTCFCHVTTFMSKICIWAFRFEAPHHTTRKLKFLVALNKAKARKFGPAYAILPYKRLQNFCMSLQIWTQPEASIDCQIELSRISTLMISNLSISLVHITNPGCESILIENPLKSAPRIPLLTECQFIADMKLSQQAASTFVLLTLTCVRESVTS